MNSFLRKIIVLKIINIYLEFKYQNFKGKKIIKTKIKVLNKNLPVPLYKSNGLNKFILILKNKF